jgi:hypothetical protein
MCPVYIPTGAILITFEEISKDLLFDNYDSVRFLTRRKNESII